MKKKIFILCILFIILTTTLVQASTMTLKSSSNSVKPGNTFTVIIHISCPDGINGFFANYSYDTNNLELINSSVGNSSQWSNLGQNNEIAIISNTSSIITDANVFELTFKVKENAVINAKSSIKLSNIIIDSDKSVDSKTYPADQEVLVTIASIANPPTNPSEKDDTTNDTNQPGTNVKPPEGNKDTTNNTIEKDENQIENNVKPPVKVESTTNSIGKDNNKTENNTKPSENIKNDNNIEKNNFNKTVVISNSNIQKNTVSVTNKIPYTGSNIALGLFLTISIIIVVGSYILYRKYKNVI